MCKCVRVCVFPASSCVCDLARRPSGFHASAATGLFSSSVAWKTENRWWKSFIFPSKKSNFLGTSKKQTCFFFPLAGSGIFQFIQSVFQKGQNGDIRGWKMSAVKHRVRTINTSPWEAARYTTTIRWYIQFTNQMSACNVTLSRSHISPRVSSAATQEAWYAIPGSNYFLGYGPWVFISNCCRPPTAPKLPNRLHLPDCTVTHGFADSHQRPRKKRQNEKNRKDLDCKITSLVKRGAVSSARFSSVALKGRACSGPVCHMANCMGSFSVF